MTSNPFNRSLDNALKGTLARVADGNRTYTGWIERVHHGRGSVLLHDVETTDGEELDCVFVRSPGTIAVLSRGKTIADWPLAELHSFALHDSDFTLTDDFITECARRKFAGSFPLVRDDGTIIDGHKRVAAARRAGLASHPVEVMTLTDEQAEELYRLAHPDTDPDEDTNQPTQG